ITDHAQQALGDVVFVELPAEGEQVQAGKPFGVVESVKAVSDIYSPVDGTVKAVNHALEDSPEIINRDSYGQGWIIETELAEPTGLPQLMDAAQYEQFVREEAD
ncbi:MAG TPA: glycine cleavage system protein GcvH, partial [Desulfobacteria bacterium]|nr:glycine cleavage system protein GcvH [Desulfobacteria bacterium]